MIHGLTIEVCITRILHPAPAPAFRRRKTQTAKALTLPRHTFQMAKMYQGKPEPTPWKNTTGLLRLRPLAPPPRRLCCPFPSPFSRSRGKTRHGSRCQYENVSHGATSRRKPQNVSSVRTAARPTPRSAYKTRGRCVYGTTGSSVCRMHRAAGL